MAMVMAPHHLALLSIQTCKHRQTATEAAKEITIAVEEGKGKDADQHGTLFLLSPRRQSTALHDRYTFCAQPHTSTLFAPLNGQVSVPFQLNSRTRRERERDIVADAISCINCVLVPAILFVVVANGEWRPSQRRQSGSSLLFASIAAAAFRALCLVHSKC